MQGRETSGMLMQQQGEPSRHAAGAQRRAPHHEADVVVAGAEAVVGRLRHHVCAGVGEETERGMGMGRRNSAFRSDEGVSGGCIQAPNP